MDHRNGGQQNQQGYQALASQHFGNDIDEDSNAPVDVTFVPESSKARWNHIEDLDSFFTRIYFYHQKHGFICIILKECFELFQFIFVVFFATFLIQCIDYPILFKDKSPKNGTDPGGKITLHDAIIPTSECISNFSPLMWFTLLIALIFWILRFVFVVYNTFLNWEIRAFYRTALNIQDIELDNLTWYDVQKKLRDVQKEHNMCIHKQELSELDIYHRILRFKNYMIAMVNKSLLQFKFNFPLVGEVVFLTHGLKYNIEMLLFWGPWAPFENSWHLREDFKKLAKRKELANALSRRILWVGVVNLAFSPIIFLWQILYSFFNYAEVVKREPGTLGMRRWSLYGRLYLRHFNELEHQLNARLSRAYRPAAKYMSIFNSPFLAIIAQNVAFISGAIFAVLSVLAIWDEDVLTVEHVLLLITVLGALIAICRAFIPDEQLVWCPEKLLTAVLAHVHYFPDHWKGQAHTTITRDQFSLLFQYKAVYLLEELLSPFITPIILIFYLRPKALEIVDFYRNFTVEVIGVGDVCSFAQMDVRKHGNPAWLTSISESEIMLPNTYNQAENGKTELSLVHFKHTNPDWAPPSDSEVFITNLKERATRDAQNLPTVIEENPLFASLNSLSSLGNEYSNVVASLMRDNNLLNNPLPIILPYEENENQYPTISPSSQQQTSLRGYLNRHEGPLNPSRGAVSSGIRQSGMAMDGQPSFNTNTLSFANSFAQISPSSMQRLPISDTNNLEAGSVDMSLDALYMHELMHHEMRRRNGRSHFGNLAAPGPSSNFPLPTIHQNMNRQQPTNFDTSETEKTPLLLTNFHKSS